LTLHFLKGDKMKYGKEKREKMMGGGYAEMMRKKKGMGGRMKYMHGGDVKMDGCQPVYNGTPKAKAN
jgi:hypothetical protein